MPASPIISESIPLSLIIGFVFLVIFVILVLIFLAILVRGYITWRSNLRKADRVSGGDGKSKVSFFVYFRRIFGWKTKEKAPLDKSYHANIPEMETGYHNGTFLFIFFFL